MDEKKHIVHVREGDELNIIFMDMPAIRLTMTYNQILEAALQWKLAELHRERYAQEEGSRALNAAPQQMAGAYIDKKW